MTEEAGIHFTCSHCAKRLRAGREMAGKRVKCPQCGTVLTIPDAGKADGGSAAKRENETAEPPSPLTLPDGAYRSKKRKCTKGLNHNFHKRREALLTTILRMKGARRVASRQMKRNRTYTSHAESAKLQFMSFKAYSLACC